MDGTTKPIEKVRVGDKVWSRDPQTGKTLAQPVIGTRVRQAVSLVTLTLSDATGKVVQTLQATPEHPFFVALPGGDHRSVICYG